MWQRKEELEMMNVQGKNIIYLLWVDVEHAALDV